jgi:hypothetical protein
MSDIGSCLAAFAGLSSEERERGLLLMKAYNDAVQEVQPMKRAGGMSSPAFCWDDVERLVSEYRADRLYNLGPAMARYLSLLDRGYRYPRFA